MNMWSVYLVVKFLQILNVQLIYLIKDIPLKTCTKNFKEAKRLSQSQKK